MISDHSFLSQGFPGEDSSTSHSRAIPIRMVQLERCEYVTIEIKTSLFAILVEEENTGWNEVLVTDPRRRGGGLLRRVLLLHAVTGRIGKAISCHTKMTRLAW